MKKFFVMIVAACFISSCGNSYIENYEEICKDAKEQVEAASSAKEVTAIIKQMRNEIKELNEEYPEEAEKYRSPDESDEAAYKMFSRRIRAVNEVNAKASVKRRKLLSSEK